MKIYGSDGRALTALADNAALEAGGNLTALAFSQQATVELLQLILREQQIQTHLLAEGLNLNHIDIAALRDDPNFP